MNLNEWRRSMPRLPVGRSVLALSMTFAIAGCGGDSGPPGSSLPVQPTGPSLSAEARQYLEGALDTMENHSVRRLEIDWPDFRAATLEEADGAVQASDTYEAIESAVARLEDNHSRFVRPQGAVASLHFSGVLTESTDIRAIGPDGARGRRLGDAVGYVAVPRFSETDAADMTRLATDLQTAIREVDSEGTCGWIVDLRGNTGGNMFPMLAGVGPVLGEGDAGSLVDPEGDTENFFYEAGEAGVREPDGSDRTPIAVVSGAPYVPRNDPRSIAVLTSRGTASSGEAIAVAFRGHPVAVSLGQATSGLSTGVRAFPLSDGATLFLATTTMADRIGRLYGEEIPPDIAIEPAEAGDPVLEQAYELAIGTQGCSGPETLPVAPEADISGSWTGIGNSGGLLTVALELEAAATDVIGDATVTLDGADEACTLDGTRTGAEIALALECPSGSLEYAGLVLDDGSINGVMGGGLPDVAFGFERR